MTVREWLTLQLGDPEDRALASGEFIYKPAWEGGTQDSIEVGEEVTILDPLLRALIPGYSPANKSTDEKFRMALAYAGAPLPAGFGTTAISRDVIVASGVLTPDPLYRSRTEGVDDFGMQGDGFPLTRVVTPNVSLAQSASIMTIPSATSYAPASVAAPLSDDGIRARVLAFAGAGGSDPGDWGRVPAVLGVSSADLSRLGLGPAAAPSISGGAAPEEWFGLPSVYRPTTGSRFVGASLLGGGGSIMPLLLIAVGLYFANKKSA